MKIKPALKKGLILSIFMTSLSTAALSQNCNLGEMCKVTSWRVEYNFLPSVGNKFKCWMLNGDSWLPGVRVSGDKDFYFTPISFNFSAHADDTFTIEGRYFEKATEGKIIFNFGAGWPKKIKCDAIKNT